MLEGGHAADREILLDACRRVQVYDRQCEGGRAPYLVDLLHATGEPDSYADRLHDDLLTATPDADGGQIFDLCVLLLRGGRADLRPILYGTLERHLVAGERLIAESLITLDKECAFRFVVAQVSGFPASDDDLWQDGTLLDALIGQIGEGAARRLSERLTAQSSANAAYLARVWQEHDRCVTDSRGWHPRTHSVDRASVCAWIDSGKTAPPRLSRCPEADRLDGETLRGVAAHFADICVRGAREPIVRGLRLFQRYPFPHELSPLLRLVDSDDAVLAHRAVAALSNNSSPAVRERGQALLRTPYRWHHGVRLLVNNAATDDMLLVQTVLDATEEIDHVHHIGLSLLDYLDANPLFNAVPILTRLYERGPCSLCRGTAVDKLIAIDAVPEGVRRECRYDANPHIREAIASAA